jgi:hypothetical protein
MSTTLTRRRIALDDVDTVERDVQRPWESKLEYCRAAGELDDNGRLSPDHARAFLQPREPRAGLSATSKE